MANVLKHRFASAKADGADATQVQPSHWNDGHLFIGGVNGDVLTRDTTDATFGAKWATPAWLDLPYSAGNYAAGSGGTWTVEAADQTAYAYQVMGKTLFVNIYLSSTVVGGAPVTLNVALPIVTTRPNGQTFVHSAASGVGGGFATTSGSTLLLYRDIVGTAWPAGPIHLAGMLIVGIA